MFCSFMIPLVTMVISFASYTLIQKKPLSAATIFSAITVFDMITTIIFWMVSVLSSCVGGWIGPSETLSLLRSTKSALQSPARSHLTGSTAFSTTYATDSPTFKSPLLTSL